MCGITGIISKRHLQIAALNKEIKHRGPDDEGVFNEGNVSLGHQRLSILDLSLNGHQPMHTEDRAQTIVFNGEIYNHRDIRRRLSFENFKSTSDTETVLYAYKECGASVFKDFNGIFAFALYDKERNKLVLCRDHFGVKPLYYYFKDDLLLFSSEIKAFLKVPCWERTINHKALVNYIHFLWSPGTETPFKYVKKLEAGHYVEIDRENPVFTPIKYYEIPFNGEVENFDEEEWVKKVDTAFSTAVERQLLSDVPVGFFLSGGLDSSLIVAKAREISGKKLQCYTIDTEFYKNNKEGFANDLYYANKVAKCLDVKLEVVPADVDIVKDFDKMIWHLDEPQADAAPLNVLNICKVARQKDNVVLLGGAGGDDLFSGYRRHQALNLEKYLKNTPAPILQILQSIVNKLPSTNPYFRRAQKLLRDSTKSFEDRLAGYYEWLPYELNKSLFSKSVQIEIKDYVPSNYLIESLRNIPNEKEALNKLLYWDMKFFLTDHNLNYTDKMSMAVGVEARVPFLDTELVELSTKIPISLKMKGNTTKYILKKMAEKYLPNEVIYRPKTGFGAPVRKWIIEDLDEMIHDYLAPQNLENRGIFNPITVWKIIEDNKKGKIDASYTIWSLLAIESWFRQFVD